MKIAVVGEDRNYKEFCHDCLIPTDNGIFIFVNKNEKFCWKNAAHADFNAAILLQPICKYTRDMLLYRMEAAGGKFINLDAPKDYDTFVKGFLLGCTYFLWTNEKKNLR